jgi:serine/threonine protein kinase
MSASKRLDDLLVDWDDHRRAGRPIDPQVLCHDCPDLLTELLRRIATLENVEKCLVSAEPPTSSHSTLTPGPPGSDPPAEQANWPKPPSPAQAKWFTPAPAEDPFPRQIGRYLLLGRISAGGQGSVYKAQDPALQRVVALKRPHFAPSPDHWEAHQRFLREARAAAVIHHPRVCPIHDVGEEQGTPYIVMAFVEGQSLASRLSALGRFEDLREAADLVCQVADGLAAIHAHGIIHRDLKPGNILINRDGQVVLTDFGLARLVTDPENLTAEGALMGTPAYMAPEQAAGETARIGSWTDIYSLGVVLYKMITGRVPFDGPPHTLLFKIVYETPPPPSAFRPGLDPALEAIVVRAMARRPEDRFPTAQALAEALRQWAAPRPFPPTTALGMGPGLTLGNGYTLIKWLGDSFFGEVWQARAPDGAEVALKIGFRILDETGCRRVLRSLTLTAAIRHPHFQHNHAFWIEKGRPFIAMKLAQGSLRDRLNECRSQGLPGIPPAELVGYFLPVAGALDYLHAQGLVHRAIHPDNLLLSDGVARVADCGLARALAAQHSILVSAPEAPVYMAPEMFNNKVNRHTDQYCLALAYVELRLNRLPFAGADLLELMSQHTGATPDLDPLPPAEQQVLRQALAKKPDERFTTCTAFALALQAATDGGPVAGPDQGRSHRLLAAVSVTVALGWLAVGFAAGWWTSPGWGFTSILMVTALVLLNAMARGRNCS